jgi:hypothetical protein
MSSVDAGPPKLDTYELMSRPTDGVTHTVAPSGIW